MASCLAPRQWPTPLHAEKRRGGRRTRVALPVLINLLGQSHSASLQDLSEAGAMVETDARLYRGDEVLFRCGAIEVRARVAWQTGRRSGLEFCVAVPEKDIREQLQRADFLAHRRNARAPVMVEA